MDNFNVTVALLSGTTMCLGLISKWLSSSPLPPTLIALVIGVAGGPAALSLIDLEALGDKPVLMERAARLALGIGLVGVALRIPSEYIRHHW